MGRFWALTLSPFRHLPALPVPRRRRWLRRGIGLFDRYWGLFVVIAAAFGVVALTRFVRGEVDSGEIAYVFGLGLATAARVAILIVLASLVWVPIGVWIGLRPLLSQSVQPIVIFMAAFPANLMFPLAVSGIINWSHDPEIWLSPLMILGTQWYILFNVIGAAAALPTDLREAAASLGLARWPLWRRVLLPAIPGLRHRRPDRLGRCLERQCRRRGGVVGQHDADGHRHRRLHRRPCPAPPLVPRHALGFEPDLDVLQHVEPGEQRESLEHHADDGPRPRHRAALVEDASR